MKNMFWIGWFFKKIKIILHLNIDKLWLDNEKLKPYPYTLGLHQVESIIILIDIVFSCICNSILHNCDMYFMYLHFKKMYLNAY
jgi:hypothetical protein